MSSVGPALLLNQGHLSGLTLTLCWVVVLFFASARASSAYLTVSEVLPMETRALAIAFFYAIGTAAGGISGPLLFAGLIKTGKVGDTALAFAIGAALMIAAGIVAALLGVKAEQKSLEDIATPLTAEDADEACAKTTSTPPEAGRSALAPAAADPRRTEQPAE